MAKLVNVAVSEAVGSSPLRVRVSLRAQKGDSCWIRFFIWLFSCLVSVPAIFQFIVADVLMAAGNLFPMYREVEYAYNQNDGGNHEKNIFVNTPAGYIQQ